MSQHASFLPPNVLPPDPPGTKAAAFILSAAMSLFFIGLIGFICVDFWTDFVNFFLPYDTAQEKILQDECGPFISDFLGLSFPGQYASMFGKNARVENYPLTEEDQTKAIQHLQNMFQQAEKVIVEIFSERADSQTVSDKLLLFYDHDVAAEWCTQVASTAKTSISPLDYKRVPNLVFTFYPSDVKVNMSGSFSTPSLFITLGTGMQRLEGSFSDGFAAALLNARLESGETVHSCIPEWFPLFPELQTEP